MISQMNGMQQLSRKGELDVCCGVRSGLVRKGPSLQGSCRHIIGLLSYYCGMEMLDLRAANEIPALCVTGGTANKGSLVCRDKQS